MPKFFRFTWASTGDKTTIPDETDVAGFVSYQQGYGNDYARDPAGDPLAKLIERDKMNQLYSDLTENVQYWQTHAFPEYITAAQNGGVAYAYDIDVIVRYDNGGGYKTYQNTVAANSNLPTGAGWVEINLARDLVAKNLTINIASNADLTLTASQNLYAKLTITDSGVILTTGRNVIVDNVGRLILFTNSTAQTLTVKTAAGTGVAISAGSSGFLINDGTNVTNAINASVLSFLNTNNQTFSAYAGASQNLTTSVFTKIQFNTEEFDTAGVYDNVTNYRFQPTVAGYYNIAVYVALSTSTTITDYQAVIYKNGAAFKSGERVSGVAATNIRTSANAPVIFLNGTTDYVEGFMFAVSTGTLPTTAGANNTYFQATLERGV